jgi:hypothetical protein
MFIWRLAGKMNFNRINYESTRWRISQVDSVGSNTFRMATIDEAGHFQQPRKKKINMPVDNKEDLFRMICAKEEYTIIGDSKLANLERKETVILAVAVMQSASKNRRTWIERTEEPSRTTK